MTELQTSQIKTGSLPGTFAPANPIIEQVQLPQAKKARDEDGDLDALARMICDRISSDLELELQRNGYHRITSIFSRGWTTIDQSSFAQSGSSPSKPDTLGLLTRQVEILLRQRLVIEQERQGRFIGRLPW